MRNHHMERILIFLLAVLASLSVTALAAEEETGELEMEDMEASGEMMEPAVFDCAPEETGVFQNGAFGGPQTVPGEPELLANWEQDVYRIILTAWKSRSGEADFSSLQISRTDAAVARMWDIGSTVLNDHPELFYANWYGSHTPVYASSGSGLVLGRVKLIYHDFSYYGCANIDEAIAVFDAAANKALAVVEPGMTEVEKALVLHDYLVEHCAYNREVDAALKKGGSAYTEFLDSTPNKQLSTAFGALVNGDPICQSYSLAYKYLLEKVGIDSIILTSSAMNHAWNAVKLGGAWYQTDVTWDDATPDTPGRCKHAYFLLSTDTISTVDAAAGRNSRHYSWTPEVSCTDQRYESGWIFNDSEHAIYRWKGSYYYAKDTDKFSGGLWKSGTLAKAGEGQEPVSVYNDPGWYYSWGFLWDGGYVYYPSSDSISSSGSDDEYSLLRYSLETGKASLLEVIPFTMEAGIYDERYDRVGLQRGEDGQTIEAISANTRKVLARFPLTPSLEEWEEQAGETVGLAGLTPDGAAAVILWKNSFYHEPDLTLCAAFYKNGKMQTIQICQVLKLNSWAPKPDLKLIRLDTEDLPAYDEVHLILLSEDGWKPYCGAKAEQRTS